MPDNPDGADEVRRIADQAWSALASDLVVRTPFYAALFGGLDPAMVGGVDDLSRLPLLDKAALERSQREHPPFGDILGVDPAAVKQVFQTSGSTGTPTFVPLTAGDLATWTEIGVRSYRAAGIDEGSCVLTTLGAGPFTAGHTHTTLDGIGCRRVPVAPGDTERALGALQAGLADTVLTTPSFALHLARVMDDRGVDRTAHGVRLLIVGGEPGGGVPAVRARLERAFAARVAEVAGIGEVAPSLWAECTEGAGLHFHGDGLVWFEFVDPSDGSAVPAEEGAVGEAVYTTLRREAMPLVRFRNRDLVEVVGVGCSCGRGGPRFRIVGRSDDVFVVRGVNVHPAAVQAVVAEFGAEVTGRARVLLPAGVAVDPPVPVEVEVARLPTALDLADRIAAALRDRLTFRADVRLVAAGDYGPAGYKSPLVRRTG